MHPKVRRGIRELSQGGVEWHRADALRLEHWLPELEPHLSGQARKNPSEPVWEVKRGKGVAQ
jgi:hypothetical protein